jgi:hypothetical protein
MSAAGLKLSSFSCNAECQNARQVCFPYNILVLIKIRVIIIYILYDPLFDSRYASPNVTQVRYRLLSVGHMMSDYV